MDEGRYEHDDPALEDPALEALRAADPAASVRPDLSGVHSRVRPSAPGLDDLSRVRQRRRSPVLLQSAAALVLILAAGSSGFALGQSDSGAPPHAASGAPSEDSAAHPELGQPEMGAAPTTSQPAPGDASGGTSAEMSWYGGERVVFSSEGLSGEQGRAAAWTFAPRESFSEGTASRAAGALGAAGEPRSEFGSWVVGSSDGTGATVSLQPDGLTSLYYNDPELTPYGCVVPMERESEGSAADGAEPEGGAAPPLVPCQEGRDLPPPPSDAAALELARGIMESLGVDLADFELEVADVSEGSEASFVTAHLVLDGERVGPTWSMAFVGDRIQHLSGFLAPRVSLGEYEVVSPQDAVERLSDPRFASGGPVHALGGAGKDAPPPGAGAATSSVAPGPEDREVPAAPEPGAKLAWPVQEVTIVEASLTSALYSLPGGSSVLLPTYELSSSDRRAWTVLAVAGSGLDFSPR